jgi:uncharacterized membrane protein SirB2
VITDALGWVLPLRRVHVALVIASGSLFTLRGIAVLLAARWPMLRAVRAASVAIDSALLAAGVALWTILQLNPLRETWLGVKRARHTATRAGFLLAALIALATMLSVALTRHPLGFWRLG